MDKIAITNAVWNAVASMVCLGEPGAPLKSCKKVGAEAGIPYRFVLHTLIKLGRAGLVKSGRGFGGGYTLAKRRNKITLDQIVAAIDGEFAMSIDDCCALSPSATRLIQGVAKNYAENAQRRLAKVRLSDLL